MIDGVLYVTTPLNNIAALDAETGRELWRFDGHAETLGPLLSGSGWKLRGTAFWRDEGRLRVFLNNRSRLLSLDAQTGKALFQGRLGVARREGFSASPVAVDGKVFFTNDEGETFVLRAGPSFELLHVNDMGERTLASPALVDGRWYIRTERNLYAAGR